MAPTFHSGSQTLGFRQSNSNYVFNHLGNFAAGAEAICKALFLGGVPRRFPELCFGFMEGGVGWATQLYISLVSYWEKRNADAIQRYNPSAVDMELLTDLFAQFGERFAQGEGFDLRNALGIGMTESDEFVDEWAAAEIKVAEDIATLFAEPFYFGCEADDPMVSLAFDTGLEPFGTTLNAMFSSDVSHWDVIDMRQILPEAYELVEHGRITTAQFERFTYGNAHRFYTTGNPSFFSGTQIEGL